MSEELSPVQSPLLPTKGAPTKNPPTSTNPKKSNTENLPTSPDHRQSQETIVEDREALEKRLISPEARMLMEQREQRRKYLNQNMDRINHYALANPFSKKKYDRLDELEPFVYMKYVECEFDKLSKLPIFKKKYLLEQEKIAMPIAQFLNHIIQNVMWNCRPNLKN